MLHFTRRGRPRSCFIIPCLEVLEGRCLPSVNLLGSFKGLDYTDAKSGEPPDTILAAGPNHIVETVNTSVAFYQKATGALVFLQKLNSFFAPVGVAATAFLSDPLVTYDELAGRFIVSVLQISSSSQSSFLNVAVSNDADPTHGFAEMHRIDIKETISGAVLWGDYP